MTEKSYYWDGLVTGDAVEAPYSANLYTYLWKKLFTKDDNQGVINSYLNELLVSGISGGIIVANGAALVAGTFYENTSNVTISIPTPTTNPRIDRIVVRKDWGAQTARAYRIAGTEGAPPSAPALTQTLLAIWEIPLAQVYITTAGVITITDEREFCHSPLCPKDSLFLIEHQESDGTYTQFNFQDIPTIYDHLQIIFQGQHSAGNPFAATDVGGRFNGDAGANYGLQSLGGFQMAAPPATFAGAASTYTFAPFGGVTTTWPPFANYPWPGQCIVRIPNYLGSIYKTIIGEWIQFGADDFSGTFMVGSVWRNTDPINSILVFPSLVGSGTFLEGSICTLYGIRN